MIDDTIYSNPGVIVPIEPSVDETNLVKVDVAAPRVLYCNCVCILIVWKVLTSPGG
jgi:hypothetical protein